MTWTDAFAELNTSVEDYFGESVDYLSLDGGTAVAGITATLNRGGEDGMAVFNMPVASVAVPAFGDKITASDGDWRISEILQKFSDRTPCNLRRADFWFTIAAEYYDDNSDTWKDHTIGITAMVIPASSAEVIDAEDGRSVNTFEVHTENLNSITHKMRFKWGSRYLYVTGVISDATDALKTVFEVIEEEA